MVYLVVNAGAGTWKLERKGFNVTCTLNLASEQFKPGTAEDRAVSTYTNISHLLVEDGEIISFYLKDLTNRSRLGFFLWA